MFFSIEPNGGVPIYEQIVRQVKFAVAEGTLRPGQLIPSVRLLSRQLAINPNTIARAFQQLQADGTIESLRGRGLVVRADTINDCVLARQQLITQRLRGVMVEAFHAGFSATELRDLVLEQMAELEGKVATVAANSDDAASASAVVPVAE